MSSFATGILAGIGGAANTYQGIQDEQRKYNIDQKKLQAENTRREHFAKYNYDLKQQGSKSGMVDEFGKEFTNEEYALLGPDERKKVTSSKEYGIGLQAKQNALDDDGRVSQYSDPSVEGGILTRGEADELLKKGVKLETIVARKERLSKENTSARNKVVDARQLKKDTQAESKATKKDNTAWVKDKVAQVRRQAKDSEIGGEGGKVVEALNVYELYKDDPRIAEVPEIRSAITVSKRAPNVLKKLEESKGMFRSRKKELSNVRKGFVGSGKSGTDFDRVVDYLIATGQWSL